MDNKIMIAILDAGYHSYPEEYSSDYAHETYVFDTLKRSLKSGTNLTRAYGIGCSQTVNVFALEQLIPMILRFLKIILI